MKPSRTPAALLDRLAARVEEIGEERHRKRLAAMFPPTPACPVHGWSPRGPGLVDPEALRSLCPHCYAEDRRREREEEQPETRTIELDVYAGSPYAQRAWEQQKQRRMESGEILVNTPAEREVLRFMDNARLDERSDLRRSASDRREANARYWGKKFRVHRQSYQRHPARAGP